MLAVVAVAGLMVLAALPAIAADATAGGPAAMPDRPDLEARNFFQSGRYADALAIYRQLYADTHHPTYLRNIGRCHQMMREPQPAIESFRAYLRDARNLDPGERAEIEGYIAEMQRLEVAAPSATATNASASFPGSSVTSSDSSSRAITHKWWFWTGLGALALTGLVAALAASGGKDRLPCPSGAVCPP